MRCAGSGQDGCSRRAVSRTGSHSHVWFGTRVPVFFFFAYSKFFLHSFGEGVGEGTGAGNTDASNVNPVSGEMWGLWVPWTAVGFMSTVS